MTVTRVVPHNVLDAATWVPHSASRGTVLVGRGEHPGVHARLGRRLAFDGYTVVVPDAAASDACVVKGAGFAEPPVEIPAAEPARARRAAPLHISARRDYAMRAMAELVIADGDRLVRSEALAHAQDIR